MRAPSPTDFTLDVEGVGIFIFGRRTGRDRFKISTEIGLLTGFQEMPDDSFISLAANAYATVKTMMVAGPDGFIKKADLDGFDSGTTDSSADVIKVFLAYSEKENSFRSNAGKASEGKGEGASEDVRDVVPDKVQPAAK